MSLSGIHRIQRRIVRRHGYTLIELVVGMVASTLLLVGMASAIAITAKAVSPPRSQLAVLKAAEASSVMADEIQSAVFVSDQSATSIGFVLSDRDGDNSVEKIHYEWNAQSKVLSRQQDLSAGSLINDLSDFAIIPDIRNATETLGGTVSESAESILSSVTSASSSSIWSLSPYEPCGHALVMSHESDVTLWSISEVSILVRKSSYAYPNEKVFVQIREAAGDGLPTSTVLAEGSISISGLSSSSFSWETVTLTGAERLLPTQNVCIVVKADETVYGTGGQVAYARSGYSDAGSMLKHSYYSYNWSHDYDDALYYSIKGTQHTVDSTSHLVVREYIAGYEIQMQYGGDTTSVRRRIRLLNTPENVSGIWKLDFNSESPDVVNVDYDNLADWVYSGSGAFSGTSQNSVLPLLSGQTFRSSADNDFSTIRRLSYIVEQRHTTMPAVVLSWNFLLGQIAYHKDVLTYL